MALFGSSRDVSLFRSINRELLHRIIDVEVLIYKLNLNSTSMNVYDETSNKVYESPVLVSSLITIDDQVWNIDDYTADITQTATFAFLRDDLVDQNIPIEIGDVIEFKSRFFEIDSIVENQNVVGKDPDSWFGGDGHGYNVSVICQAHMTRQSKLDIIENRFGNSVTTKDYTLPSNL